MSDRTTNRDDDEAVERLLRESGDGPSASAEARARVYAAVHERWRAVVPPDSARVPVARRTSRWARGVALAASLGVVAIVGYVMVMRSPSVPPTFASIARSEGAVEIERGDETRPGGPGGLANVRVGDRIVTAEAAKVALRLEGGYSLRLNSASELTIEGMDVVSLETGAVYFDSAAGSGPFRVETPFGTVRHDGTQYEAALAGARLRIRVREGKVVFSDDSREVVADGGEQIQVGRVGDARRSTIAPTDPAWQWAAEIASAAAADPYPLPDALAWIARETGRSLRFDSAATEARAQSVVLHELQGLTPSQTLDVIRRTTAFDYRYAEDGLLIVESGR